MRSWGRRTAHTQDIRTVLTTDGKRSPSGADFWGSGRNAGAGRCRDEWPVVMGEFGDQDRRAGGKHVGRERGGRGGKRREGRRRRGARAIRDPIARSWDRLTTGAAEGEKELPRIVL